MGFHIPQGLGKQFENADGTDQFPQSAPLVEAQQVEAKAQPLGMGQGRPQEEPVNPFQGCPLLVLGQGLGAGVFHDAAVGDAGGTDGFAGPALEAHFPVGDDAVADAHPPLVDGPHQGNAAPGRFRLYSQGGVGGAGAETQAAMDAAVQVGFRRHVHAPEARLRVKGRV